MQQQADNIKKLNQAQRTLETTLATAHETIRKKEADIKSLLYALEDAKEKEHDSSDVDEQVILLEEQLALKEEDYLLLFNKLQDMEAENADLRGSHLHNNSIFGER